MSGAYPIRPIGESEFPAYYAVIEHAFNSTYPTEPELQHDLTVFEFDRSLAAFDGPARAWSPGSGPARSPPSPPPCRGILPPGLRRFSDRFRVRD
jgi:hypothetical protein